MPKVTIDIPEQKFLDLAKDIMENYPEYSFCLTCISYDYEKGVYKFLDEEDGKEYTVTVQQIAEKLPKLMQMLADKKLFLDGLNSSQEMFFDGGCWDCIATDAAVQLVIFDDVIYG